MGVLKKVHRNSDERGEERERGGEREGGKVFIV